MDITALASPPRADYDALTVEVVEFLALEAPAQDRLLQELFALDRAVFDGATPADLEPYLRDPDALAVPVVLTRDRQGRLVGQNIIPIVRVVVDGRAVAVANSIAGTLPGFRGRGRAQLDAGRALLAFKLRHPSTPMVGGCVLMHPGVYRLFVGRCAQVWPRPDRPTPPEFGALLRALAARDGSVHERAPGVFVQSGLPVPRAGERGTRRHTDPMTRFFERHVPDYDAGHGLYCVMPLTFAAMAQTGFNALRARWGRR